jgi:hypothetical protein
VREEKEGETVRKTVASIKKPRLGCLYLRKRESASAAIRYSDSLERRIG